jgi:hypothetical protein
VISYSVKPTFTPTALVILLTRSFVDSSDLSQIELVSRGYLLGVSKNRLSPPRFLTKFHLILPKLERGVAARSCYPLV